jgi:TolA-binding protein
MRLKPYLSAALIVLGFAAASCSLVTTKEEGLALKRKLTDLEDRMYKIESELEQEQARLTEMTERARTDVEKLEDTLTRATRILARNSADFGSEMDTLKGKLRQVDGSLAEIEHELLQSAKRTEAVEQKVVGFALAAGLDLPVDESKVPAKATDHFKMIQDSLADGRYGEARSLGKLFHRRHRKDSRGDDVELLIAKSYLMQKRWAKALGVLRQFSEKYKKSKLTAEVLYEMARSFFALGSCTDARILIEAVTVRYKKSPFAGKANLLSQEIKKHKSRCSS